MRPSARLLFDEIGAPIFLRGREGESFGKRLPHPPVVPLRAFSGRIAPSEIGVPQSFLLALWSTDASKLGRLVQAPREALAAFPVRTQFNPRTALSCKRREFFVRDRELSMGLRVNMTSRPILISCSTGISLGRRSAWGAKSRFDPYSTPDLAHFIGVACRQAGS